MTAEFQRAEAHLLQADVRTLATLLSGASDVTLVLDGDGIIEDLSHNLKGPSLAGIASWRGQPIEDVVRSSDRAALRKELRHLRDGGPPKRFDLSHLLDGERDLPVQYSAFRFEPAGQIVMLGRDLRVVAELQSRLMASRQALEENTRNRRRSEVHYRLLFETAAEAIVILDAASGKIREANPRAAALLGTADTALAGKRFSAQFDKKAQRDVQALVAQVLTSGTPGTLVAPLGADDRPIALAAELFRAGDLQLVLVRLSEPAPEVPAADGSDRRLDELVRNAAEGVLLTDQAGTVLWANESFLMLADIPIAAQAIGRPFGDFFRWSGVEASVLLQNLGRHGRVQNVSGTVEGANGRATDIHLSGIVLTDQDPAGYGFVIRPVPAEGARNARGNSDLTRTAENLVEMIGRVPMKDLVRDTTDVIEKMCIEAALGLTGNNRASAARVLGLSRQALYLKMNRFGIAGDGDS